MLKWLKCSKDRSEVNGHIKVGGKKNIDIDRLGYREKLGMKAVVTDWRDEQWGSKSLAVWCQGRKQIKAVAIISLVRV